jgi:hypothetical protein
MRVHNAAMVLNASVDDHSGNGEEVLLRQFWGTVHPCCSSGQTVMSGKCCLDWCASMRFYA